MRVFLRRHSPLFMSLAAMLVLYIPWINRGYVNLEFCYTFAAKALAFPGNERLFGAYWFNIANPLGYPIVVGVLYKFFGVREFWISRLPAIFGAGMILIALWLFTKSYWTGKKLFLQLAILVLLSPMIFVFSTTGTADIFPVGLLFFALGLTYYNNSRNVYYDLIASVIFGLSIVTKYNGVYFGLAFIAISISKVETNNEQNRSRAALTYIVIPGLILVTYLVWSELNFDVFISSRLGMSKPKFLDLRSYAINFVKYLSFLGLFCSPLTFFALKPIFARAKSKSKLLVVVISVLLFSFFGTAQLRAGELDFGLGLPGGALFGRGLEAVGLLGGLSLLYLTRRVFASNEPLRRVIFFSLLPYAILVPATYPSQRYLLFVLPFALLMLIEGLRDTSKRLQLVAVGSTALIFAAVSLLGMSYLRAQGNASEQMAVWIEENGLISETSPGVIFAHSGQHFWGIEVKQIRYEVIAVNPGDESKVRGKVLHREPMNVLGEVTRVYLLREVSASP